MLMRIDSAVRSLTMFGDVAVQLLELMGHSGTVPSAILARDIPQALARLEAALAGMPPDAPPTGGPRDDDDEAPKVSLRQRAYPLIELARRAAKADADLLWDKA